MESVVRDIGLDMGDKISGRGQTSSLPIPLSQPPTPAGPPWEPASQRTKEARARETGR